MADTIETLTIDIKRIGEEIAEKQSLLAKIDEAIAGRVTIRESVSASIEECRERLNRKRELKEQLQQSESWTNFLVRKLSSPELKPTPTNNNTQKVKRKRSLIDELEEEVATASRLDHRDHWPYVSEAHPSGQCKVCLGRTNVRCEKCEIALHPKCFKSFHV